MTLSPGQKVQPKRSMRTSPGGFSAFWSSILSERAPRPPLLDQWVFQARGIISSGRGRSLGQQSANSSRAPVISFSALCVLFSDRGFVIAPGAAAHRKGEKVLDDPP